MILRRIVLLVVLLDQATKWFAWEFAPRCIGGVEGLSWCWLLNRGISWSLCTPQSETGSWILAGILLAITVGVVLYMQQRSLSLATRIAGSCIVGGSLSNIADRLAYGGVVDWIVVQWHGWVWPVFNIADVAIVLGVIYVVMRYETT